MVGGVVESEEERPRFPYGFTAGSIYLRFFFQRILFLRTPSTRQERGRGRSAEKATNVFGGHVQTRLFRVTHASVNYRRRPTTCRIRNGNGEKRDDGIPCSLITKIPI